MANLFFAFANIKTKNHLHFFRNFRLIENEIEVIKEDEYVVDGSAKLDDISELIGVNMESEEFDSVGGLIIGELGRFPENKEEVNLNNIRFVVEEVDKNRIKKVRIYT